MSISLIVGKNCIVLWIDDLSDQALIEWYCDDTGYPQEEITGYIEDEIALGAAE